MKRISRSTYNFPPKIQPNAKLTYEHVKVYINIFDKLNDLCDGVTYRLGNETFITKRKNIKS